jgi:hypothetical protein
MHRLLWSFVGMALICSPATAQLSLERVEEDWELVVGEPDWAVDAPQATVTLRPFVSALNLQLQINLNHALVPDFVSGGIQVRVIDEDNLLGQLHLHAGEKLEHQSETVRWTTAVQKISGGYSFGISTGVSQSWGAFGGNDYLLAISQSLVGGHLEGYTYEHSLDNSGVSFAGNRVQSMRLLRVRYFYNNGQVYEQQVHRDVN